MFGSIFRKEEIEIPSSTLPIQRRVFVRDAWIWTANERMCFRDPRRSGVPSGFDPDCWLT